MSTRTWTCTWRPRWTTSGACWERRRSRPTTAGYRQLLDWLRGFGDVDEGGCRGHRVSYGAGLCRRLHAEGVPVVEVDRPNRQTAAQGGQVRHRWMRSARPAPPSWVGPQRRGQDQDRQRRGDPGAAGGRGSAPARPGPRRSTRSTHWSAPPRTTCATGYGTCPSSTWSASAPGCGPATDVDVTAATKLALRTLARRVRDLERRSPTSLALTRPAGRHHRTRPARAPRRRHGHRRRTAGRRRRQPRPATHRSRPSPGSAASHPSQPPPARPRHRHRLHRGGDRHANSALWRIVLTRMSNDPDTRAYVKRRNTEGLSKREVMRCLKRYIARELYPTYPHQTVA